MGGLAGCRGGGGHLSLVVLVSEKPNSVSEKSGNFIYLWCWQPCICSLTIINKKTTSADLILRVQACV